MKTSLQIKMGQQLTMTPQLQQAIRLLQLSTLDLQQEIQEALDSNPMLESEEFDDNSDSGNESDNDSRNSDSDSNDRDNHDSRESSSDNQDYDNSFEDNAYDDQSGQESLDEQWSSEKLPDDLPVDSQWEDTYQVSAGVASSSGPVDEDFDYDSRYATSDNLQDHLLWQLNLTPMSDADREVATMLIDGVDDDTADELQARARDYLDAQNRAALENARELGVEDSLVEFEGLTPQMIEALAKDDVKTLEDFATCADWELAGGWTTVDGERVKDDGILEPFDVSLEEAQNMVMTARIILGWVDPADLEADAEEDAETEDESAEEEAGA